MPAILNLTTGVVYLTSIDLTASGTFTISGGVLQIPDGASSAPSISFSSESGGTHTGIYRIGADSRFAVVVRDTIAATFMNDQSLRLGNQVVLLSDTADMLSMRNGVNPNQFRVYNTYTAGTPDSEFLAIGPGVDNANVFEILSKKTGLGAQRNVAIGSGTGVTGSISFRVAGTNAWQIDTSGNLNDSGSHNLGGATTTVVGGTYKVGASLAISGTAPTVSAGFGSTSPGVVTYNTGTLAVVVTVGTNAGGTTGTLTFPSAPHGWAVVLQDVTNSADLTRQTGYTQTTAAFSTTVAWTTGDVLVGIAVPF